LILDPAVTKIPAHLAHELTNLDQIRFSDCFWIRQLIRVILQPLEEGHPGEGEVEFIWIHDMNNQDIVTGMAQSAQSVNQTILVIEKIRQKNDETSSLETIGYPPQHLSDIGSVLPRLLSENSDQILEVASALRDRSLGANLLVED